MRPITTVAIWFNSILILTFVLIEVFGIGPIARYRAGECYSLFANTGAPIFWLVVYAVFFFIKPVVDLLAIILKPRVTINNYGVPES